MANVCLSSRKDFRDAVLKARAAVGDWSSRAAFNRSQILYRMAEMLEGRKAQFIEELILQDGTKAKAEKEVNLAKRARRKKIMKQAKGFFGRRKNVWTVKKTQLKKRWFMLIAIENKIRETSVHCGFNVLTLELDWKVCLIHNSWD